MAQSVKNHLKDFSKKVSTFDYSSSTTIRGISFSIDTLRTCDGTPFLNAKISYGNTSKESKYSYDMESFNEACCWLDSMWGYFKQIALADELLD